MFPVFGKYFCPNQVLKKTYTSYKYIEMYYSKLDGLMNDKKRYFIHF